MFKSVAVKLKGSAGSSQKADQRPGLTINMTKMKGTERFHGMKKFHLNNGAQDGSLLNEYISGEMCRAALVPASRCTHVVLKWQGRDMGIYIFKETFNEDFFHNFTSGWMGTFTTGISFPRSMGRWRSRRGIRPIRRTSRSSPRPARKPTPLRAGRRWRRAWMSRSICVSWRWKTFTSHWDGYNFNTNNYRIYF